MLWRVTLAATILLPGAEDEGDEDDEQAQAGEHFIVFHH